MKWYCVKKHKPYASNQDCFLVRTKSKIGLFHLQIADYEDGMWVDKESYELIEVDDIEVTHFCIPDPIEIEE